MKQCPYLRRAFALLLALALLLPLSGPLTVMDAGAVTQEEIDALKQDANALAQQKKDIEAQLKALQADKSQALGQKDLLEQQIDLIQQEIGNITQQIEMYDTLIAQRSQELADAQVREQEQYALFCQRIRAMEEEGEVSYWSILFSSGSFAELLDNFIMVEEIIAYDNGIMESLVSLREQIAEDKAQLEAARADQEAARQAQEAAKAELAAQEAQVDQLIGEISAQEDLLEAMEAELRRAAAAMDEEIKRKERELAAQIANVPSESGFLWPLTNYNTLSSLFGKRKDPFTGRAGNHTGVDIPAPKGTPILASKSGVVITSVNQGSYGNYVVVSHSDGTSTLYAHMSRRLVREGQTVKQGNVVGEVGTTGRSTGNHLHFEIRLNGNRVDPVDYFKDKTLYMQSGGRKVVLEH